MTGRACERCEWWTAVPVGPRPSRGICRGAPPTGRRDFPITLADDWCGLFRLREAQAGGYDRRSTRPHNPQPKGPSE